MPVFVHCQRGADHTGTMCAIYRIVVQGWEKNEPIEEVTKGDFDFFDGWQDLIDYVLKLGINEIKRRIGLEQKGAERGNCSGD